MVSLFPDTLLSDLTTSCGVSRQMQRITPSSMRSCWMTWLMPPSRCPIEFFVLEAAGGTWVLGIHTHTAAHVLANDEPHVSKAHSTPHTCKRWPEKRRTARRTRDVHVFCVSAMASDSMAASSITVFLTAMGKVQVILSLHTALFGLSVMVHGVGHRMFFQFLRTIQGGVCRTSCFGKR